MATCVVEIFISSRMLTGAGDARERGVDWEPAPQFVEGELGAGAARCGSAALPFKRRGRPPDAAGAGASNLPPVGFAAVFARGETFQRGVWPSSSPSCFTSMVRSASALRRHPTKQTNKPRITILINKIK